MIFHLTVTNQELVLKESVSSVEENQNYIQCVFDFTTEDWNDTVKTAYFRNPKTGIVTSQILSGDQCTIPPESLSDEGYVQFSVAGEKEGYRITSTIVQFFNRPTVYGGDPSDPTPSQYEQIITLTAAAQNAAEDAQQTAEEIREQAESGAFNGKDGQPGKDGAAATVTVGTVTTGEPGTDAAVTNTGTQNAAVLDFVIPQGEKGDPGNSSITEIRCKNQGWVQVLSEAQTIQSGITYQQPFYVGSNALILLGSTADAGKPGAGGTFITVLDDSFRIAFKPVQGDTQTVDLTFETLQAVVQLIQVISYFAGAIQNCDPGDIVTVLDQDMETGLYNLISKPADSALSDSSTFAVQNKVVTTALAQKKAVPAISTPSSSSITLENNSEYRLQATASLNLALPESIPDDYECELIFESGETATVLSYPADTIEFIGNDCDKQGDFVPVQNTSYEVKIKNLGFDRIIGWVTALKPKPEVLPADYFTAIRYGDWVMGAITNGVFQDSTSRIRSGHHFYETGTEVIIKIPSGFQMAVSFYSKSGDSFVYQTSLSGWQTGTASFTIESTANYAAYMYGFVNASTTEPADGLDAEFLIKPPAQT